MGPKARSHKITSNVKQAAQIPEPFEKASTAIEPFLQQLDPAQVYITHIDRHTIAYKQQIFFAALAINASIAALLVWRVYVAAPQYLALVQTFLGYVSSATVDTARTTRQEQMYILLRRTLMFVLDFLAFRFIGPWPLTFFFEQPANPATWRWNIGFQPQEVVVRVSRNWGGSDLMEGVKQGQQNPFFKTRILPAIERDFMQKTGYLMMGGSWDLDFPLIQDAHTLFKQDKIKIQDLDKLVLTHQEGVGWIAWKFEKDVEANAEDEQRKKMMAFKTTLTGMGKESLFWRWQEIVEEEREKGGGFSPETQKRVAARVEEVFIKEGVDFEEVMKGVGGVDAMPAK